MKNNIIKRFLSLFMAVTIIFSAFFAPLAYAEGESQTIEDGYKLGIETDKVVAKNIWQQIKNAAIIHLVAQKMKKCQEIGEIGYYGIYDDPDADKVLDKGQIFMPDWDAISPLINVSIAVGPWLDDHIDNTDGQIECNDNDGALFNMFVYILNNYKASTEVNTKDSEKELNVDKDFKKGDEEKSHKAVTREQRLKIVCNGLDGYLNEPGLLRNQNHGQSCEAASDFHPNEDIAQFTYLSRVYEKFRQDNSANEFIRSFASLGNYDEVEGYYLYSLDFKKQCGGSTFNVSPTGTDFRINNDGYVEKGTYSSLEGEKAYYSFVGGSKTCTNLRDKMNSYLDIYVKTINKEILAECKIKIDEAIERQTNLLEEKREAEGTTDEQKQTIDNIEAEYEDVKQNYKYVAKRRTEEEIKSGVEEEVIAAGSDGKNIKTEYIWTCRSSLPYIEVLIADEQDLEQEIDENFARNKCKEQLDLGWLICPIVDTVTKFVDTITEWIENEL